MTTNAVYGKAGTVKVFKASGGDVLFTPKNIANGAGRISSQLDLGSTLIRPERYGFFAETQLQATTPVIGQAVNMFMAFGDTAGTYGLPGRIGTSDAALSTLALTYNMHFFGSLIVDTTSADSKLTRPGELWIPAHVRYCTLVWWNATGASLTNDDAEHFFSMWPLFDDIQAAA